LTEPAKNPFAKKPPASNPFAKPALPTGTKALEASKSTSFFERVDNIESSGVGAGVKTTRHPKRKESGGGKQQTLFPMKSKSKDAEKEEVEVEVDETMIETPTEEMDVEVESEELQEAQAPSIVGDSLVCLSVPLSSLLLHFS
jgi:chromosome transmission fidelity protein 4